MGALCAYLKKQAKEEIWRTYMAQAAYLAARPHYKDMPIPQYAEMMADKPHDTRSGAQINEDIIKKLQKRKERRNRENGRHESV